MPNQQTMGTHGNKTKKPVISACAQESQSVINGAFQKHSDGKTELLTVENQSQVIAQRRTKFLADNSPQALQLKAYQQMANDCYQGKKNTQLNAAEKRGAQKGRLQLTGNKTGLPDNLKTGIENLSGYSMDDVKVHYHSDKPAQLHAHAYAQGTDIHVAPAQERHLPHEAWHVIQQKQGRVKPTLQLKGKININDDAGLEKEANVMGEKAHSLSSENNRFNGQVLQSFTPGRIQKGVSNLILQRILYIKDGKDKKQIKGDNLEEHKNKIFAEMEKYDDADKKAIYEAIIEIAKEEEFGDPDESEYYNGYEMLVRSTSNRLRIKPKVYKEDLSLAGDLPARLVSFKLKWAEISSIGEMAGAENARLNALGLELKLSFDKLISDKEGRGVVKQLLKDMPALIDNFLVKGMYQCHHNATGQAGAMFKGLDFESFFDEEKNEREAMLLEKWKTANIKDGVG